jgi:hypothetical protein
MRSEQIDTDRGSVIFEKGPRTIQNVGAKGSLLEALVCVLGRR